MGVVLFLTLLGCEPPAPAPPPPPLAAVARYDKVTGYATITTNRPVWIQELHGWAAPMVAAKDGNTVYGLKVYAETPESMAFTPGAAALYYAKGPFGEARDTIAELLQVRVDLVDFMRETAAFQAHQVSTAAGALGSMLAGSAAYYKPPPFYGERYERVHYWKHDFLIPLKREAFQQILAAEEVTFRLNHRLGSLDFSIPPAAKEHFRLVEEERARRDAPAPSAGAPEAPVGSAPAPAVQAAPAPAGEGPIRGNGA